MVTSFKRSHAGIATLSDPNLQQAIANPHLCRRLLDTHGQVWVSLLWGHYSFLLGPGTHKLFLCPPRVCFSVLCEFWQLYGGVNGDLPQEGLCHTQVCCTQSPCPSGSPLLTRSSTGDTQTQFWLRLCGVSGSWCAQGLLEPSGCLWRGWGLILNAVSPLALSCWGFSFALGCGVSPESCSSAMQLLLQRLLSCWDFSVLGR